MVKFYSPMVSQAVELAKNYEVVTEEVFVLVMKRKLAKKEQKP